MSNADTLYLQVKPYIDTNPIVLKSTINELVGMDMSNFKDILIIYYKLCTYMKGIGLLNVLNVTLRSEFNVSEFKKIITQEGSNNLNMAILESSILNGLKYVEGYVSNFVKDSVEEDLWLFKGIDKAEDKTIDKVIKKIFSLDGDSNNEMGILSFTNSKGDIVNIKNKSELNSYNQAKLVGLINSDLFTEKDKDILNKVIASKIAFAKKKNIIINNAILSYNDNSYDILKDYDEANG